MKRIVWIAALLVGLRAPWAFSLGRAGIVVTDDELETLADAGALVLEITPQLAGRWLHLRRCCG